jgi:hypothetical protein
MLNRNLNKAAFRIEMGADLNNFDFMSLNQNDIYGCRAFNEFKLMLTSFAIVIRIIFGSQSIIFNQMLLMIGHYRVERQSYIDTDIRRHRYWFMTILFRVDNEVQRFLKACSLATQFDQIDFNKFRNDMEAIRTDIERQSYQPGSQKRTHRGPASTDKVSTPKNNQARQHFNNFRSIPSPAPPFRTTTTIKLMVIIRITGIPVRTMVTNKDNQVTMVPQRTIITVPNPKTSKAKAKILPVLINAHVN